jgi:hypothetical protein
VLTEEQQAQAERDRTGKVRPGYVRRDIPQQGAFYSGTFYGAGEKREIPQGLADILDATAAVNPDISTEVGREADNEEDDHDAQTEAGKSLSEGSVEARVKHFKSASFEATPRPKSGRSK